MKLTVLLVGLFICSFGAKAQQEEINNLLNELDMDPEKAMKEFQKLLKKYPDNADIYFGMGLCKQSTKLNAGWEEFNKAIELNPCHSGALNIRGNMQETDEAALADYTKAIECEPQSEFYYYNRASTYLRMKNYDAALADCFKALSFEGADQYMYGQILAETYTAMKDFDKAMKECRKLISMSNGSKEAFEIRGDLYMEMGKFTEALKDYEYANDPEFNFGGIYRKIGMARLALGDLSGACNAFKLFTDQGFELDQELLEKCK